jgi:serine/threonine-protein kinase
VNQQAVRPSAINPNVSPALDSVVLKSIAKDRFERFQSAAEFRSDLTSADSGTTVIKRPAPVADFNATLFGVNPNATAGSEATMRQLTVDDQTRGSRASQSRPPVAWIWGGIAILAVVVVAVLYWTINLTSTPISIGTTTVAVADVVGQTYDPDGKDVLDKQGLLPTAIPQVSDEFEAGTILSTVPAAGVNVEPDTEVKVYVSSGAEHNPIPDIVGDDVDDAIAKLTEAGFTVNTEPTTNHSPSEAKNVVTASVPAPGTEAAKGSDVSLTISDGKVDVPDVTGKPLGEAQAQLRGKAFQLDVDSTPDYTCAGGAVSKQSKTGLVNQHSDLTLTYCAGATNAPVEPTAPATPAG